MSADRWGPRSLSHRSDPLHPTNADLYLAIGRLEGKFDEFAHLNLPKRIASLERTRAWAAGVGAVMVAMTAYIFKGTS